MAPQPGVVVVGGALAGLNTVEALRRGGYAGPITVVDAEAEPRYDRPPLSKGYLGGLDSPPPLLRADEALAALDVDWRLGTAATSLDLERATVRLAGGGSLPYSTLVLATGVAPVLPEALRSPATVTLRTRHDADRLRAHAGPGTKLVIAGAGFIGLEVAATFRTAGAEVHVVEADKAPLARHLGPVTGQAVRRLHEGHGVRFHCGTRVLGVAQDGRKCRVELSSGTGLAADVVLVAVGSTPNVGWLADSGLLLDNGIVCDERLAAAPGVYAVGDVARWPHPLAGRPVRVEHWTNAIEQAAYVAKRIIEPGAEPQPFASVPYFWSDQYGSRIQAHGFPGGGDDVELIDGDFDGGRFAALHRNGERLTAVVGLDNPRQVLAGRRRVVADLTQAVALS